MILKKITFPDSLNYCVYFMVATPHGIMNYYFQLNDVGIAECHFELVAKELNFEGFWMNIEAPK